MTSDPKFLSQINEKLKIIVQLRYIATYSNAKDNELICFFSKKTPNHMPIDILFF